MDPMTQNGSRQDSLHTENSKAIKSPTGSTKMMRRHLKDHLKPSLFAKMADNNNKGSLLSINHILSISNKIRFIK